MEAQLPKNKLNKIIEAVTKILKKKSSITLIELQSFVTLHFFASKVIYLMQAFFFYLYDVLAQGRKYLH